MMLLVQYCPALTLPLGFDGVEGQRSERKIATDLPKTLVIVRAFEKIT